MKYRKMDKPIQDGYRLEFICTNIKPAIKLLQGTLNVYRVVTTTEWKKIAVIQFQVDEGGTGWHMKEQQNGIETESFPEEINNTITNFLRAYFRGMLLEDNCITWVHRYYDNTYRSSVV